MALDRLHEGFGADKIGIQVGGMGKPAGQQVAVQIAMGMRRRVLIARLFIAKETLQLWMLLRQLVDFLAERMHAAMPCRMDEHHWTAARQRGFQHRQHWCDADTAADQHQGFVTCAQGEFTGRWIEIDLFADVHVVVEVVRYLAAGFALDADAIHARVGDRRQRILAAHFNPVDFDAQADILARRVREDGLVIVRREIERGDFCAFLDPAHHDKLARTAPAAGGSGAGIIDTGFAADQDVCQLAVGSSPRLQLLARWQFPAQALRAWRATGCHRPWDSVRAEFVAPHVC